MPPTALLGIVFVVLGFAAMFLMYHLWGYPFDKAKHLSSAPRWAMYLHRFLGYAFAMVYIALMWKMVPRLWEYQVEFPTSKPGHHCIPCNYDRGRFSRLGRLRACPEVGSEASRRVRGASC